MLEISEEIPFLWRLSSDKDEGFSHVTMVIPFNSGSENLEHTIQTDIVSFMGENEELEDEEILEWNEDDIALFMKLLASRQTPQKTETVQSEIQPTEKTLTFRVDLSDPGTIEIVHIVAAAGFGMALNVDDLIISDPGDSIQVVQEPEIGTLITLHTVDGYKRGVVVGNDDEEEVVCVLLDTIRLDKKIDLSDIHPHDLVIVKAYQLLPANYSSQEPGASDVLH